MTKWIIYFFLIPCGLLGQEIIDFDAFQREKGIQGDAACLNKIFSLRDHSKECRVKLHGRTYQFENYIQVLEFMGSIVFEGVEGTHFQIHSGGLELQTSFVEEALERPLKRGSITCDDLGAEGQFAAVKIDSRDTVESVWGYVANDLIILGDTVNRTRGEVGALNFDYRPFEAMLRYYRYSHVEFRNIAFESEVPGYPWLVLVGAQVKFEDCSFDYTGSQTLHIIVQLKDCYDVSGSRLSISGPVNYGFLISGCRNIQFSDIESVDCLQPIVPSHFSTRIRVERLFGLGSVIDAHPSFDVWYKDVNIQDGKNYWNCRALGVVLENCIFGVRPGIIDNSLYLGMLGLRDPYKYLVNEYDVVCNNVKWIYSDQEFNGLHVHQCRDFIVNNCETHAVSTGMPIRQFIIRDSRIGRLHSADANVIIENTQFSPKFQSALYIRSPLYISYSGTTILRNCQFMGFAGSALFEYIHDPGTEVIIFNSRMEGISRFTDRSLVGADSYNRITFNKCTIDNSSEIRFPDNPSINVKQ